MISEETKTPEIKFTTGVINNDGLFIMENEDPCKRTVHVNLKGKVYGPEEILKLCEWAIEAKEALSRLDSL